MKLKSLVLICLFVCCVLLLQAGCQQESKSAKEPAVESTQEPGAALTSAKEPTKETEKPAKAKEVEVAPEPEGPPAKITFEKVLHDFGKVPPNKMNTGEIKFTNTGEGLLKITKVGKCCGVVAKLDKDKTEYAPGESGAVKIEWKSPSHAQVFKRNLVVHSNDKKNPAITLSIKAEVVLRVAWDPKKLSLYLDEDNAGCPKVTVSSLDGQPFSITGFKSTGDCITADFDPSLKATKFVFEPKVHAEKLHKRRKGTINIDLTHPDGNSARIYFNVVPKYVANPPLLILFNAVPGTPIVRNISVLNNYRKDFEIESVSSKNDVVGFKVLEQRKLTHGYQLKVEITPPPPSGKSIRFTDVFSLNFKGGEKLPITCNGYYKKNKPISRAQ